MSTFTVVIATRNRREMVVRAARSALAQSVPVELLVVDNGSSDGTGDALRALGVTVVDEPQPGASKARNTGADAASSEYIAFLDDDGVAPPDWVECAARWVSELSPEVLGGPYEPLYDHGKPHWFLDRYERRTWGKEARALGATEMLSGSNMIWKKSVLQAIGGFDEQIGPVGDCFSMGEDTELFVRLRRSMPNATVWYSPDLAIGHSVTAAKLRPLSALRRGFQEGYAWTLICPPRDIVALAVEAAKRTGASAFLVLISLCAFPLRGRRWFFEHGKKLACQIGCLAGIVKLLRSDAELDRMAR